MHPALAIRHLADHPECIPPLARWFEAEWPDWYGPGGRGNAGDDLRRFCSHAALPIGLVALQDGEPVGCVALKADSIPERAQLGPWVAAGLVHPDHRRRGCGAALVGAAEALARELGYPAVFCATATAASLLERLHWSFVETLVHDGESLRLYRKPL